MENREDLGLMIRNFGHYHYGMNMLAHRLPQGVEADVSAGYFNLFEDNMTDGAAEEVIEYMESIYDLSWIEQ